ncbi:hypothetical protein CCYA_CCYA18G4567 [Cyanidiococcus yangmingshanensis]|nr:hypothetical protein CCYA_CCYA18G4567 [Cyanidiococcus yangmingshanensis]
MEASVGEFEIRDDFTAEDLLVLTANMSSEGEAVVAQRREAASTNDCFLLGSWPNYGAQEVSGQETPFSRVRHASTVCEGPSTEFEAFGSGVLPLGQQPSRGDHTEPVAGFVPVSHNRGLHKRCFGERNLQNILSLWSRPPVFTSFWLLARMVGYGGTNPAEATQAVLAHQGWSPNESLLRQPETFRKFTKERFVDIAVMLNIQHRRNMNTSTLLNIVLRTIDGLDPCCQELLYSTSEAWFACNRERVEMLCQGANIERRGFTEDALIRPPFTAISWLAAHPSQSQAPPRWTPRRLRSSRFRIVHGELVVADRHILHGRIDQDSEEGSQNIDDLQHSHVVRESLQPVDIHSIGPLDMQESHRREVSQSEEPRQHSRPRVTDPQVEFREFSTSQSRSDVPAWEQESYLDCNRSHQVFLSLVENISFDSREHDFITDRTFCKKLCTGIPESLEFSIPVPIEKMLPKMPNLRTAVVLRCFEVSNKRIASWTCAFPGPCRAWLSLRTTPGIELQSVDVKKSASYVDLTLAVQKMYRKDTSRGVLDRTMSVRLDLAPCLGEGSNSWPHGTYYVLVVQSAHLFSLEFELGRILSRRRPSYERAKALLCPASQVADDDLGIESVRVSLLCPLSRTRIQVPVRVRGTTQLQCFDAASYIEMSRLTKRYICPVTNKPAPLHALQICEFFREALAFAYPNEEFIDVLPDGTFLHTSGADSGLPRDEDGPLDEASYAFLEQKSGNNGRKQRNPTVFPQRDGVRTPSQDVVIVDLCD